MNRTLRWLAVSALPILCLSGCASTGIQSNSLHNGRYSILDTNPVQPSTPSSHSTKRTKSGSVIAKATSPSIKGTKKERTPIQPSASYDKPQTVVPQVVEQTTTTTPFSFTDAEDRIAIQESRKLLPYQKQNYLIGPDDILEVSVFEWDLTDETRILELRVSKTGVIALPALGSIKVAGLSVEDVNAKIVDQLGEKNILQDARVSVSVREYRHRRVAVLGAVVSPGMYALQENVASLLDVLSLAGGPSADAFAAAYVQQGPGRDTQHNGAIVVDLDQLFKFGQSDLNPLLRGGDSVYIPLSPLVYVYGRVKNPGAISLRRPTTILEAIALSGGFAEQADHKRVRLIRKHDDGTEESLLVNFKRIENGLDPDLFLQQNDLLRVDTASSKQAAYGLWHIFSRIFAVSYRLNP